MEPVDDVPALSINFGKAANTEGVYPRMAGGSPTAKPTSRSAIAYLVTESIISMTFKPRSRKYSAILVAINAPFIRINAG
ncbi:hypothetical protein D3C75_1202860 [compost metagenome]